MKLAISIFLTATLAQVFADDPTLGPLNLSHCNSVTDLEIGGSYFKSICYINEESLTLPKELKYCVENGMKLYTIEKKDEIPVLINYIQSNFGELQSFYIKGHRDNGVWGTHHPTALLHSAVTPIIENGGDCLMVTAKGNFEAVACNIPGHLICQFDKNSQ